MAENESPKQESRETTEPQTVPNTNIGIKLTNPGLIALGIYLFLVLILCIWILATLLMALPPDADGANISSIRPLIIDMRNVNSNSTARNYGDNSPVTSSKHGDHGHQNNRPRLIPVVLLQQSSETSSLTPSNPSETPKPTPSAASDNEREVRIQGIPSKVRITFHLFLILNSTQTFSGEAYLLLIVLFSGALGAGTRAIFSYFHHIGEDDFSFRWAWYYILSPFGGAAISIVLYLVIRGGFYNPTAVSGNLPLNPFSFAALGALSGLFSENAMQKLRTIAAALLEKVPDKSKKHG